MIRVDTLSSSPPPPFRYPSIRALPHLLTYLFPHNIQISSCETPLNNSLEVNECNGVPVPDYLRNSGTYGAELIVLPTSRPAAQPVTATACRWLDNNGRPSLIGTGRPVLIHVRALVLFPHRFPPETHPLPSSCVGLSPLPV
jgi:hypothetical protein